MLQEIASSTLTPVTPLVPSQAVTENLAVKADIFQQLDKLTPLHSILASNTSSISITKLGAATTRPHR